MTEATQEWTSWEQQSPKNKSPIPLWVPVLILAFIGLSLTAFLLFASSASAAGGCGGG